MNIIEYIRGAEEKIVVSIEKYGRLAQHRYHYYLNYGREKEKSVFIDADGQKGILAYRQNNVWRILTDPLAPTEEKKRILIEALDWLFISRKARKIILEDITEELRKDIAAEKSKVWRALATTDMLSWPIVNLEKWDVGLGGGRWKRLRNTQNKFFRKNKVEIRNAVEADKSDLKKLVLRWKKQRSGEGRAHYWPYLKFIENDFDGCDMARVIAVNGEAVSFYGGWTVPNRRRDYYSAIGVYDYDFNGLGEISYLTELAALKERGYQRVDLGGSGAALLAFKMKFHPTEIYRTHTFSVLRR